MTPEILCLALAIYFEARGEPVIGQVAVGQVVINRTADRRYPNNVCEVVKQGPTYKWTQDFPVRHRCQFSWYCDGKSDIPRDPKSFTLAVHLSAILLAGEIADPTEGATHYHASYVRPSWAAAKTQTLRIDNHIFYRWEQSYDAHD
jgi:spore germination cell wall hydrolase CwlJ-like protein